MRVNRIGEIVWCTNHLVVHGKTISDFVKAARGADRLYYVQDGLQPLEAPILDFSFHKLFPVPEELLYDQEAGYKWEMENWGVSWGPSEVSFEERDTKMVRYRFDTRDLPPTKLIQHISNRFTDLVFGLTWGIPLRLIGGNSKWLSGKQLESKQYKLQHTDICFKCQELKDCGNCPVCGNFHLRNPWG